MREFFHLCFLFLAASLHHIFSFGFPQNLFIIGKCHHTFQEAETRHKHRHSWVKAWHSLYLVISDESSWSSISWQAVPHLMLIRWYQKYISSSYLFQVFNKRCKIFAPTRLTRARLTGCKRSSKSLACGPCREVSACSPACRPLCLYGI
jgi:hypothetical protein